MKLWKTLILKRFSTPKSHDNSEDRKLNFECATGFLSVNSLPMAYKTAHLRFTGIKIMFFCPSRSAPAGYSFKAIYFTTSAAEPYKAARLRKNISSLYLIIQITMVAKGMMTGSSVASLNISIFINFLETLDMNNEAKPENPNLILLIGTPQNTRYPKTCSNSCKTKTDSISKTK